MSKKSKVKEDICIKATNKYDGSKESKERLSNLFYITLGNIDEYVNYAKQYRSYLVKILNRIGEDKNESELQNYLEIANRVLKITESKNISDLVRILFNTLTAFDALKGYVLNELDNCKFTELTPFIEYFKKLLTAKCIDTNKDFDLGQFLHDVRNTYLHSGVFVAKLEFIPSGQENKVVPSIAIQVNKIWTAEYLEKIHLANDYVIDTLEVFEKYQQIFDEINIDDI